jgi:sulfite exporter TauE/SafE
MDGFLGAMLLLGVASGLHCVGMCGGIVGAFSAQQVLRSRREIVQRQLAFNFGRIASYAAAGALAGAAGSVAAYAGFALPAQTALYVLANVVLVLIALHIAGVRNPLSSLEQLGMPLWRRIQPLAAKLLAAQGTPNAFAAGAAWGWLPCGLVYGALAAAAFAGSPARGALAMAAFGLGTLPYLLAAGFAAAPLRSLMRRRAVRLAAAAALLGFGTWGLARASGLADTVQHTLLCL